ncbi:MULTISPECIES: DUF5977 domain-containing protein [unclassified Pedobacter]|uniref:DUF5977 domain-containing protein n=1 Tax=unclassified Pedobacter TaxID=2628915 RepID=UPI00141FF053|nr:MULTISPECIES: DUF5977 domain-containing protein [unclassified Pedobacter]NII85339.1 hypothetical protein [Pedobacter sp. SG908]NMN39746.1 hypothetical protein [Pedobacter sp. SG918]
MIKTLSPTLKPNISYHLILALFFIIVINGTLNAQDKKEEYTRNFSIHSPTAFAFSKIDNIPMNNFTGMASINLPLYEKKMSVLNFNMALTYTGGGGIKAGSGSSTVGKGWLLHTGGAIIRHTRGVPDDYQSNTPYNGSADTRFNGLLYNTVSYKPDGVTRIPLNDPVSNQALGYGDSEHDVFEFNIPGKSGKFYIGKDKQVIIVTDSKVKIIPDFTSSVLPEFKLGSFLIIDEAGIKYSFNQTEVTSPNASNIDWEAQNKQYPTSWLLTKIEAPFGEESITYEYIRRGGLVAGAPVNSVYVRRSDIPVDDYPSVGGVGVLGANIKRIVFSDQSKINFKYFLDDSDPYPANIPLLKSIEILNPEQTIVKSYNMTYKIWRGNKAYYTNTVRETKNDNIFSANGNNYLNHIDLVGSNHRQTMYAFDYFLDQNLNEESVPNGYDFWGYYNGKNNAHPYLVATAFGPAADRNPDLNYAKLGSIKKIIYPTGGSEEFEYELNDKQGTNNKIIVAGLRIKKRILHDGINAQNDMIKEYRYVETDGLSSGFLGEQPEFTFIQNTYYDDGGWPSNPHVYYTTTTSYAYPVNPLSSIDGSFAGYRRVEELLQNGDKSNGKIVYEYSDLSYTTLWTPQDYHPYRPVDRPYWAIGLPLKTTYFSSLGAIVKQTINEYNIFQQQKIDDNYRSLYISSIGEVHVWLPNGSPDPNLLRYIYKFKNYYPIIGRVELKTTHEYNYPSIAGSTTPQLQSTYNTYDANYFFLRTSSQPNSNGDMVKKYFYYPFDYNLGASSFTAKLTDNNIINKPILTETWLNKASSDYLTQADLIEYQTLNNGTIRPLKAYTARLALPLLGTAGTMFSNSVLLPSNYNFKPVLTFNTYDNKSRLVEFENQGGIRTAIILDKSGNVLAKADNASFSSIAYTGFETEDLGNWNYGSSGISSSSSKSGSKSYNGSTISKDNLLLGNYNVSLWAKGNGTITVNNIGIPINNSWNLYKWNLNDISSVSINTNNNLIDQVALSPQNAQMTVANYNKTNDIENTVDVKGNTSYFEYDEFARLINIKDQDRNGVKNYAYQFKPPFLSISQSGSFTNTCPPIPGDAPYTPGPPVTYTIPAGKYSSIISQEDADAQAWSDVHGGNGQTYANANGTCNKVYYNTDFNKWFTRNNCPANTTTYAVNYRVPAKTVSSIISQEDADAQAQAYADANGQAYANANGLCAPNVTVTFSNSTSDSFGVSFSRSDGYNKSFQCNPGSSSLVLPGGIYSVYISVINAPNSRRMYVGSRSAIEGTYASFTNVNISSGTGSQYENTIGMY